MLSVSCNATAHLLPLWTKHASLRPTAGFVQLSLGVGHVTGLEQYVVA